MPVITKIKRNDTAPSFTATVTDGAGVAINIVGASVLFLMRDDKRRLLKVSAAMVIVDGPTGKVRYDWAPGDTDTPGIYKVEVQVTFSDATIETFPNGDYHRLEVLRDLSP